MNWMRQFRQRIEQERQSEPTPTPKAVSTDWQEVSGWKRKDAKIRCFKCDTSTAHRVEDSDDYPGWLVAFCVKCGAKQYIPPEGRDRL